MRKFRISACCLLPLLPTKKKQPKSKTVKNSPHSEDDPMQNDGIMTAMRDAAGAPAEHEYKAYLNHSLTPVGTEAVFENENWKFEQRPGADESNDVVGISRRNVSKSSSSSQAISTWQAEGRKLSTNSDSEPRRIEGNLEDHGIPNSTYAQSRLEVDAVPDNNSNNTSSGPIEETSDEEPEAPGNDNAEFENENGNFEQRPEIDQHNADRPEAQMPTASNSNESNANVYEIQNCSIGHVGNNNSTYYITNNVCMTPNTAFGEEPLHRSRGEPYNEPGDDVRREDNENDHHQDADSHSHSQNERNCSVFGVSDDSENTSDYTPLPDAVPDNSNNISSDPIEETSDEEQETPLINTGSHRPEWNETSVENNDNATNVEPRTTNVQDCGSVNLAETQNLDNRENLHIGCKSIQENLTQHMNITQQHITGPNELYRNRQEHCKDPANDLPRKEKNNGNNLHQNLDSHNRYQNDRNSFVFDASGESENLSDYIALPAQATAIKTSAPMKEKFSFHSNCERHLQSTVSPDYDTISSATSSIDDIFDELGRIRNIENDSSNQPTDEETFNCFVHETSTLSMNAPQNDPVKERGYRRSQTLPSDWSIGRDSRQNLTNRFHPSSGRILGNTSSTNSNKQNSRARCVSLTISKKAPDVYRMIMNCSDNKDVEVQEMWLLEETCV
ncbi:uncharacterized protein LOC143446305 isoform X2 [Clavelina lepadiformis]